MRSTADTLSLSWLPPEKPNGVILDYEIKYHERVSWRLHLLPDAGKYNLQVPRVRESFLLMEGSSCNVESLVLIKFLARARKV